MSRHLFRYLIFPPVCVGCGERFDPFEGEVPTFCLMCRVAWEKATHAECPVCHKPFFGCVCSPQMLVEAGCTTLYKLCRYHPEKRGRSAFRGGGTAASLEEPIETRLLLRLKDRNIRRAFEELGQSLGYLLRHGAGTAPLFAAPAGSLPVADTVVTFIPRSRAGFETSGFDQGEKLARELARALRVPLVRCFLRRGGSAQKSLSAKERARNVRESLLLCRALRKKSHDGPLLGKTVILVDDIVTSGATMARCTELLCLLGASRVVGAAVAVSLEGLGLQDARLQADTDLEEEPEFFTEPEEVLREEPGEADSVFTLDPEAPLGDEISDLPRIGKNN